MPKGKGRSQPPAQTVSQQSGAGTGPQQTTAAQKQSREAPQQPAQQPPIKKVKKEPTEGPPQLQQLGSKENLDASMAGQAKPQGASGEQPTTKRPRQLDAVGSGPSGAPSPARAPARGGGKLKNGGIAGALSEVRAQLESIVDVEGVREQLDCFPACVLLGGIALRRELVAALLGEHAHAATAAASLVAPGMRQPIALELRWRTKGTEGINLAAAHGPEAEAWLRSVSAAAQPALGNRLKVDVHRIKLTAAGCANLDVVDLPERSNASGIGIPAKMEEMRLRHMGSPSNLLVCLEPGQHLELCRRFDPKLKRTVLLGAAAASTSGGDALPPSTLCGPAAARSLEDRFAALCHERLPQWLVGLERLESRLSRALQEAREVEQNESSDQVLRRARGAGLSFGRALEHVIDGAPGCKAGALTLEEELIEFAASAAKGQCGLGSIVSPQGAAAAAADIFSNFQGVEGYSAYLRNDVRIAGAEVPLNGGAAWQRLLAEIEVAMRLAHPPPDELAGLTLAAVQAGGTGVHGHQRWEDVSAKLMHAIAFEPLRRRIRYVAARVAWVLRQQKAAVAEWMATMSEGPGSRLYSPLFAEHLAILRSSPMVRDLVFGAFDKAAAIVAEQVLKNLEGTLTACCINPQIMLRPKTCPDMDPSKPEPAPEAKKSGKASEARSRVVDEMRRRSGTSGGMVAKLQDRVFDAKEAMVTVPFVEGELRRAFSVLANILANQAFAFSDTSMAALCRRHIDESMNSMAFSEEQQRALSSRHGEFYEVAKQVDDRLGAIQKSIAAFRSVRS